MSTNEGFRGLPIGDNDDAALRMLGGAYFEGTKIRLPSGREIGADEANAFTSAFEPVDKVLPDSASSRSYTSDRVRNRYARRRADSPLSSANDRWTGDPATDRALLVARAFEAMNMEPTRRLKAPRFAPGWLQRLFKS